jgi:hypothetical protein
MTTKANKTLAPRKELAGEEKILPEKVANEDKLARARAKPARPPSIPPERGEVAGPEAERPSPPSILPDRGEGSSKAKEFRSMKPDRSQAAACRSCGWAGVIGDCAERGMGGDAYSEGWAWHCPHCKAVVEVYAWRQLALIATSS